MNNILYHVKGKGVYFLHKDKCLWLKLLRNEPINSNLYQLNLIRAQRGYINHGTLYYTNLTHTHTRSHTYILIHLLH